MDTPHVCQKSPKVEEMEPGTYWWCSCGYSSTQPFCDGAHKGSGLTPLKFHAEESKTLYLCGCKHSQTAPLCDGSHKQL